MILALLNFTCAIRTNNFKCIIPLVMKNSILFLFFCISFCCQGQVGINTTNPEAQLDVKSSNQALPSNKDGLLIPKIDTFPAINPTIAQQGMLVYLTTQAGVNQPGFYYWNNSPAAWLSVKGNNGVTLDQAYDFGGAGLGKTITADAGAVLINGTDGLVSTGAIGSGAVAPSGAGTRMVWNPRIGAFRAGSVFGTEWDNANIGMNSVAFGSSTIARGQNTAAFGSNTSAGPANTVAFGENSSASGLNSTVFGTSNNAISFGETVFGIGATSYSPSSQSQFRTSDATDRLFVVGNAIDTNNNGTVDTAERSDAMVILKNGATGIGTALPNSILDVNASDKGILIPRVVLSSLLLQAPITNPQGGVLVNGTLVYNTATAGVVPNNVKPGFYYWNTNKWIRLDTNGENNSKYYSSVASNSVVMNNFSALIPNMSVNLTPNDDLVILNFSGNGSLILINGQCSTATNFIYFQILVNNVVYKTTQIRARKDIFSNDYVFWDASFQTVVPVVKGVAQTISINWFSPYCSSTAFVNIGSSLENTQNRSLIIIDPNGGGGIVGTAPPISNLWAENGNSAINPAINFVGTTDNNDLVFRRNNIRAGLLGVTNTSFGARALNPLTTGSNNTANGTSALSSNTTGSSNTANGVSALADNTTGINNTATGFEALQNNTSGINNIAIGFQALLTNTDGDNNTAIGVLSMDANTTGIDNTAIGRGTLTDNVTGASNTAIGRDALFNSTGNNNTAVGRGTLSAVTTGTNNTAIGFNAQVASTTASNQVRVGNTAVTLASVQVPWTITSDKRWKSNIHKSNLGLDFIKQLNPVSYTRKDVIFNEGKTTILEKTTNPMTEYGFIAQELENTLNKFSSTNNGIISKDDTGMYGVRYNDLIAPMVKAIQEQQVIIEELKLKITKLENKD